VITTTSILDDVKKILGLSSDYTAFDVDVILHINSVLATVTQLGIGPTAGMTVLDATTQWSELLGADNQLNSAKTYVALRVRLLFDPPTSSYAIKAMEDQIREFEWRISTYREGLSWVSPIVPVTSEDLFA
jgi:hypothetical protein